MLSTILVCLLAAAIAGIPGYYLSFRFNQSIYAATDTSGDFGTARGGFIATFAGILVGMTFFSLSSHFPIFPSETIGPAMIVSMIVGAVAGFMGLDQGMKRRSKSRGSK